MSDNEEENDKVFCIDKAKQGRAACKKCKQKCQAGDIRIAKITPSPYGSGKMKNWHHVTCMFDQFLKQRATTRRIESPNDLDGWDDLASEDQNEILKQISECDKYFSEKIGTKATPKKKEKALPKSPTRKVAETTQEEKKDLNHKDSSFREFRRLVADICNVPSYTDKTNLVNKMLTKGTEGTGFKGNVTQWCRLLLPGVVKRIYNLQSKQLIKLFSKMFQVDQSDMLEHLEQGDIGETIQHFFEQSNSFKPVRKSTLTLQDVDEFLEELSQLTKEDEQMRHLKFFTMKCTSGDLKVVIRLIKHDLRINAGAKHILDGVHPDAYQAYQASRDLDSVIKRCLGESSTVISDNRTVQATISVLTPVRPMLAEVCKSVEQALKRCPNGMFSEIKYDGERVQVHKEGTNFKYYSRSLLPVVPHKIAHFKDYIPQAFPYGKDLILDSEILMMDTITGKPLPFGTLGIHKKSEFKDANVCLFVFDCMYYNGETLMDQPISYRKQVLKENMTEIPNRIVFSEMKEIYCAEELSTMIAKTLKAGLEGLVLKDMLSIYEPGKRHWLKIKKDYLFDGAIADTADLLVLGAWYGTGKKGGMMSVFLMGCYDIYRKAFCTVTKVHTGHDDKTLERLQGELDMIKISSDVTKVPSWLKCTKTMVPDLVARDPKSQPVWEITGAEFTQHDVHTADGISIRFPRVTRIREDKNWETATTLQELHDLVQKSKDPTNFDLLMKTNQEEKTDDLENQQTTIVEKRKRKNSVKDLPVKKKRLSSDGKTATKIKQPIPDYFEGVKLLLEEGIKQKFPEEIRNFVAYGGVVLKPNEWKKATHVLHLSSSIKEPKVVCPKSAKHITSDWINDTIAACSPQDIRLYTVLWESSGN